MCFLVAREAERILPHGVIMMGICLREYSAEISTAIQQWLQL